MALGVPFSARGIVDVEVGYERCFGFR
jgi:hypothetical protein